MEYSVKHNRIIFIDVDGVLNNRASLYLAANGYHHPPHKPRCFTMDTSCVHLFKSLLDDTQSKFVISSSWRGETVSKSTRFFTAIEWCGFANAKDYCVGVTPRLTTGRGTEIDDWLARHDVANFVILDDDSFDITQSENFVQTDHEAGFTVANLQAAKKILCR